jgi:hypothetical protein
VLTSTFGFHPLAVEQAAAMIAAITAPVTAVSSFLCSGRSAAAGSDA